MPTIYLTNGGSTEVDEDDYDYLMQWTWYKNTTSKGIYYVFRSQAPQVRIHRLITKAPKGTKVDHKDHDTFNNRKYNLRVVTHAQNMQNRLGATSDSITGIRGVSPHISGRYRARVVVNYITTQKMFSSIQKAKKWVEEERDRRMTHHK